MSQQFKYVIRMFGQDIDGTMKLPYALATVKGIGYNTARAIIRNLNLDSNLRLGELSDSDIKRIEQQLENKVISNVPSWMYNRRKDYESGTDMHLVTSDLIFYARNDIEREKKSKSWRGVRHSIGLKVRGQRTRTTGRVGYTIGVSRKKVTQPTSSSSSQKSG
ncbi:30S ribosomal protein S13 [Sulfuracidifex metallicus]|jgi:small subunit ribosomal protein S13|uniref:Small ribosomal subunit protein uS13 n=1 Tax=Sulfuracidifex metallicus DSM 6482 = JCM 9184 TaxID=523847 RepID=A0A6A9QHR9_SULME|nr:30S ribosomal protein S13 [Sulfuracidifex metallicus]MCY0850858.1 30S ribosomal protein S13 [Sulfuracidifex metallicus]MUN28787.1 30S ribosomal protein S13 [Sulfuracidifex metallicus DSM 6482 = JCM 9184]WOE50697.1 30S ribosomal protein S13 [Sulfuracidifex metallicus DSM 6482 = JCM 9184]